MSSQKKRAKPLIRVAPPGFHWTPRDFIPFAMELLAGLVLVFLPVTVGGAIDAALSGQNDRASQLTWLTLAMIIYLALNEMIGLRWVFRTVVRIERDWQLHIARLLGASRTRDAGASVAILNKDSRAIANMWHPLFMAVSSLMVAILGAWQLWIISPLVAFISLGGLILTVLLLTWISGILEKHTDTFRDTVGAATSRASDIAASIRTIAGLGAQKTMMGRYQRRAQDVYRAQLQLESVQTWSFAARNFLQGTVTLLAVAFALRGVSQEGSWITEIPAGQLVTIVGLINALTGPVWSVEMFLYLWRGSRVALRRVDELAEEVQKQDETLPETTGGQLEPPAPRGPVHYLNPRGLGLSVQETSQQLAEHLRSQGQKVLLSEPNPMIFAGSLAEHLSLGTEGLETQRMIDLLEVTDSLEIAYRLGGRDPQDYLAASISPEGMNLSGGQRQRLALARALAQQAPVLVLAEPLNSVDEPSQRFILNQLEEKVGQPGPLAHIQQIYLVSTTLEVERRLEAQKGGQSRG